ncbi:ictacalcin-like [Chelmon rostratus]|uniref:ictacalcin-like n=1 Tax=Chelmon rostratus TaxID=109905 RepID=UPI001BE8F7F7|nr:ictacalcin-like [Chelmon rostratus]
MSDLVQAMALLRSVFNKHAGKEGDPETLTKKELCDLLKHEGFVTDAKDKCQVDNFFKELDNNQDGVVSFQEYVTFVAALSVICYGK